jgi:CheY-like chemotaxis protein
MHVLLVEDNTVNQRVVQAQLKKAGCTVYVANHGVEALDMIRESDLWHENVPSPPNPNPNPTPNSPLKSKPKDEIEIKHLDIILMDWEMPIMDGLACSREIRKLQEEGKILRHVEILATTANARDEQVQIALESGVDDVISKPFLVGDLLLRMRERLSFVERPGTGGRASTG